MKLNIPRFNFVKYGKENVSYYGTILWNDLPNEFKNTTSFDDFEHLVNAWEPTCQCSYCDLCVIKIL